MLDNFKNIVDEFEEQFTQVSKGSSLFCGSSGNPKQLDQTYKRLAGY